MEISAFCKFEDGNASWKLDRRLPVVTGGAEPQEGGGIARAWIADPYTRYTKAALMVFVRKGTVVATGRRLC